MKVSAIYQFNESSKKIKNNLKWPTSSYDPAADKLSIFLLDEQVKAESQENLEKLFSVGKSCGADKIIFTPKVIQLLGTHLDCDKAFNLLGGEQLQADIREAIAPGRHWHGSYPRWRTDVSNQGACLTLHGFMQIFTGRQKTGIYDVTTKKRITNRRQIIDDFWQRGFVARRGTPLIVAALLDSGTSDEIAEITMLYNKYCGKRPYTNLARRHITTYSTTVRRFAWPGSY